MYLVLGGKEADGEVIGLGASSFWGFLAVLVVMAARSLGIWEALFDIYFTFG